MIKYSALLLYILKQKFIINAIFYDSVDRQLFATFYMKMKTK